MNTIKFYQILLLSFLFSFQFAFAQVPGGCEMGTATAILDGNNVKATLNNSGTFLFSYSDGAYEYPVHSEPGETPNLIFSASLWLGGFDPGGSLRLAANTYSPISGATDFFPGPLEEETGSTNATICSNWDRMFKVTKESIEAHKADLADNGVIDGPIPDDILLWPGHNNTYAATELGIDLNRATLAPYIDVNGDAAYTPEDGDYPDILGATTGVWWLLNENGNAHMETEGANLLMETHYLAYSYESDIEAIDNTTFYKVTIVNRGIESVSNFYASIWMDPDLGCFEDDYIGSLPEENLGYVYNADPIDGDENCNCAANIPTYCEEPPIMTVKILDGLYNADYSERTGMSSFMYYNNAGFGTHPPATTDPNFSEEFYSYMTAKWRDNVIFGETSPLTYGGTGYNPGSTDVTSFAYSGETAQGNWSMCLDQPAIADRRILLSTGPTKIEPGASNQFTFAITGIPNQLGPCDGSIPVITDVSNTLDDFHNNVVSTKETFINNHSITIAPNPMSDYTTFDFGNLSGQIKQVQLFSIDGKLVRSYDDINDELTIDKNDLNVGMYFYKVYTNELQLVSGKLMVL